MPLSSLPETPPGSYNTASAIAAFREAAAPPTPHRTPELPRVVYTPSSSYKAPNLFASSPMRTPPSRKQTPTSSKPPPTPSPQRPPSSSRTSRPSPPSVYPNSPHNSAFSLDMTPPNRRKPPRPPNRGSLNGGVVPSAQTEELFRQRSAHVLSPIFTRAQRPSQPPPYREPDVRALPDEARPSASNLLPDGVLPELAADVPFSADYGFEKSVEIDFNYRATRIAMPFCIRVLLVDADGPLRPVGVTLEIDPDVRPSMLVAFLESQCPFGWDSNGTLSTEAVLTFWAAPDSFDVHNSASMLLTVTDDQGTSHETIVQISCNAVEPQVSVSMPEDKTYLSVKDQQLVFSQAVDIAEETIVLHNTTENKAPLLINIVLSESGHGAFSLSREDIAEAVDYLPAAIPGDESFRFVVRYSLAAVQKSRSTYFGIIQIKLGSMFPQGTQRWRDRDLRHAYDQIIGLEALPNWDVLDAQSDMPEDTVSQITSSRADLSLDFEPSPNVQSRTKLRTVPENSALKDPSSFSPLAVTFTTLGLQEAPEGAEFGPMYEGMFSLLEPVEWVLAENAEAPEQNENENEQEGVQSLADLEQADEQQEMSLSTASQNEETSVSRGFGTGVSNGEEMVGKSSSCVGTPVGAKEKSTQPNADARFTPNQEILSPKRLPEKTPYGKLVGYGPTIRDGEKQGPRGANSLAGQNRDAKGDIVASPEDQADGSPPSEKSVQTHSEDRIQPSNDYAGRGSQVGHEAYLPSESSARRFAGSSASEMDGLRSSKLWTSSEIARRSAANTSMATVRTPVSDLQSPRTGYLSSAGPWGSYASYDNPASAHVGIDSASRYAPSRDTGSSAPTYDHAMVPVQPRETTKPLIPKPQVHDESQKQPVPIPKASIFPFTNPLPGKQIRPRELVKGIVALGTQAVQVVKPKSSRPPLPVKLQKETKDSKFNLKKGIIFGRDARPKLRMPRAVGRRGIAIQPGAEKTVLSLSNGSKAQMEVSMTMKAPPGTNPAASVENSMLVMAPGEHAEVLVSRRSSKAGKLVLVLTCTLQTADHRQAYYELPVIVKDMKPTPRRKGVRFDRPTLSFYNPTDHTRECRVRVFNGKSQQLRYAAWIGRSDEAEASQPPGSVFSLVSPSRGALKPQSLLNLDVAFEGGETPRHFYDTLNIRVNGKLESMVLFAYTGRSDIQFKLETDGHLHVKNHGSRFGFILLSTPERKLEDMHAKRYVLGPGEDETYELPHGTGTAIYTGDEIARHRLIMAIRADPERHLTNRVELKAFASENFYGAVEAERKEGYEMKKENQLSLYYASRLFEYGTRQYGVDARTGEIVRANSRRGGHGNGWRASADTNGTVLISNCNPYEKLEFKVEGAEPATGVVPALGDVRLDPYRQRVTITARRSSIEITANLTKSTNR